MPTLACTIDATGISAPSYSDIYAALVSAYQGIFGADTYLAPDSQDGQWIAITARAISDANAQTILCYNGFSPATAIGAQLSSAVKLNGLTRRTPTASTVSVTIVGQSGTVITAGKVRDTQRQLWSLPATVTIPPAGAIVVTATADQLGALTAAVGTVTEIATPTFGWQSVTNATAAAPGLPVETDAQLRRRQSASVALPAQGLLQSLYATLLAVAGVGRLAIYENANRTTDPNGVPGNTLAIVLQGGTDAAVAAAIAGRKPPGAGTYGTTAITTYDAQGLPNVIRFSRPVNAPITVEISLTTFPGWQASTADAIKASVAAYILGLNIGDDVFRSKVYAPADLAGDVRAGTFNITNIRMARDAGPLAVADVVIGYNELATCTTTNVTVLAS